MRSMFLPVSILLILLAGKTVEGVYPPPEWTEPTEDKSFTRASSDCDSGHITKLIAESQTGSSVVITIESQMPDDGVFRKSIDLASSDETLACSADVVKQETYSVIVKAAYVDDLSNSASLNLTVIFSDFAPATGATPVWVKPNPDSSQPDNKISIEETIQNGTEIMTLSATDEDTEDATLTYNMAQSPGATKALFEVINNKLKVKDDVAKDHFDLEKVAALTEYRIVLEVSDSGTANSLTTTITVTDVNDNSPVFSGSFVNDISPSVSTGFTVFEVTATDRDQSDANKQVTLSLSAGSPPEFELSDGKIVVAAGASFDFEIVPSYTISVTASDDELDTSQDYTVTIRAVPTWIDPDPDPAAEEHLIYICETLQAGDDVMTLIAIDNDTDTASLTFSMDQSSSATKELFEIVGDKLKVKPGVEMDFFDVDKEGAVLEYPIELVVSDDDGLTRSLSTFVKLEDDNDNLPIFSGNFTAFVLETSLAGTVVLKLTATDIDISLEFSTIIFSLSGASEFEIGGDKNDSIVVAEGAVLDASMTASYNVTVTASDSDPGIPQTTEQTVTIYITIEPVFNKLDTDQDATVDENADENVVIFTLNVTDEDNTGALRVSISEQPTPEMFRLDGQVLKPKSGVIFDAEGSKTTFQLKFKAYDETNEVESAILTVNVNDVNDNPPVFGETNPVVEISEETTAGTEVYDVNATDADVGNPNNDIKYSMTQPAPERFSIDEDSGVISVKEGVTLAFQEKNEFVLAVTARDGTAATDQSADTTVKVQLKTGPIFTDPTNDDEINILENITMSGVVKTLTAKDDDGDTPIFMILSQDPASPEMFKVTGSDIVTTDTFDSDAAGAVKAYKLEIKVSDGRDYTDDNTISITVNIEDVNDNSPEFAQTVYTKDVKETEEIETSVFSVTATDKDSTSENNKITYTMSGTTDFKIDETTGNITVAKELSYATTKSYEITVTATDSGTPEKTDSAIVKITILAEPKFDNLAVAVSKVLDENLPANTPVFSIVVTDLDATWDNVLSIVSQTPAEMFKINGMALETKTNGLDAESERIYKLKLRVIDGPFTVESAVLTINIADLNDNEPIIAAINPVTMPENQTIGSEVVVIQATDNDVTEENNVLSYSISGDGSDTFAINSSTGSITLAKIPLSETYNFKVEVSDSGNPVKIVAADVSVYVDANIVDECSPNPCKNGASCLSSVNMHRCICVPGFIDTNCETNRNECDPDPCMNAGTCTDHVNFYSCNCTRGWEGQNCTDACTNNTYDRNCQKQCSCIATRLVPGVENQQCDIMSGDCKCNSNWVGASCEDRDECVVSLNGPDSSTCSGLSNVVCENTIGGFFCTCEQGYVNTSSVCTRDTSPVSIVINAGEVAIQIKGSLNTACNREDLKIPSKFESKKRKIEEAINPPLPSGKRLIVISISCASLDYEAILIIDQKDAAAFANEVANISDTVQFDGQTVSVNELIVNGSTVNKSGTAEQKVCTAFTAIEPCAEEYECIYTNSVPSCQEIEKDNTGLILGLGLGLCLPLIVLLVLAACYLYYLIRRRKSEDRRRRKLTYRSSSRKEESPWHGRLKQNGFKMDTRNYDRNHFYDNTAHFDSFTNKKNNYDMPGLGYTTM